MAYGPDGRILFHGESIKFFGGLPPKVRLDASSAERDGIAGCFACLGLAGAVTREWKPKVGVQCVATRVIQNTVDGKILRHLKGA